MHKNNGFTLLELLIALTLATMVILLLAMGMNIVMSEWERSGNRLENSLDKVLILLNIERALEGAYPHTYFNEDDNKRYIFFEGEEESMVWVSTVSPGRHPGLQIWELSPSKENDWIQVKVIPAFAGDPTEHLEAESETDSITVLEGYKATFEYLYKDEKLDDETEWLDKWSAKKLQALPNAVRMKLETDGDTEPLEVVALIQANQHQAIRPIKP
ncbi:prepilin-type N-terminal cleavage/methylation domain-containing protein [Candidatus Halobeggiatoa sp. HSG11]|nr:prepilin-type N-terminal cleavage/methylation domain-containing protein [Candidatus Halobeggiatoa sp. HSG11]